jgi:hypothetical protein
LIKNLMCSILSVEFKVLEIILEFAKVLFGVDLLDNDAPEINKNS